MVPSDSVPILLPPQQESPPLPPPPLQQPRRRRLGIQARVFLTNDCLAYLMKYVSPQDGVELMSSTKALLNSKGGWMIMQRLLGVSEAYVATGGKPLVEYESTRSLVLHVIRKFGLCCSDCFTLLEGENGFFCCTSLCKACSVSRFAGVSYVDSVVRFYLCGSENITVRGKAFLTHPFWLGEDDESSIIVKRHGSTLRLAEAIYLEKVFFAEHGPELDRPRDDKAASLRAMIREEVNKLRVQTDYDTVLRDLLTGDCSIGSAHDDGNRVEAKEEVEMEVETDGVEARHGTAETANNGTSTDNGAATPDDDAAADNGAAADDSTTISTPTATIPSSTSKAALAGLSDSELKRLLARLDAKWALQLPSSLRDLYDKEIAALKTKLPAVDTFRCSSAQTLGTMPLRDLVQNLHSKSTACAKVL